MIKRHSYVQNEFDDGAVIWKYYKLPRFLDLIEKRKLFFTRVDKFSDPNEFPIIAKDAQAFCMSIDDIDVNLKGLKGNHMLIVGGLTIMNHLECGLPIQI